MRGLKHTLADGGSIRPDFVLLDDPQTDESAESVTQCDYREALIARAVLPLAGPGKKIAALMLGNVIRKDDLLDRMVDKKRHPEWHGERMSLVYKWPDKHEDMWLDTYAELRQESMRNGDRLAKPATDYYTEHQEEMDAGSIVQWDERFDQDQGELSALQHAYNLLIDLGKFAFGSEYQNAPEEAKPAMYNISPQLVMSRTNNHLRRTIPINAPYIVGMVDINQTGLHWVMAAFVDDLTGFVIDYGKHPEGNRVLWDSNLADGVIEPAAIYEGLNELVPTLLAKPWAREGIPAQIDLIEIDCGYQMDTVFRFCRHQKHPVRVYPSRGFGARRYRQTRAIGKPGENWHMTEFPGKGRVICHNADFWRVHAQKAFLLPPGAPGSISLFGKSPRQHGAFADQICAERLLEHIKGDTFDAYHWFLRPGAPNHWLDCLVGCCVAAGRMGAQLPGAPLPPKRTKAKRKRARATYTEV